MIRVAAALLLASCAAAAPSASPVDVEDLRAEQAACVASATDYDAGEACLFASDARWCAKHPESATGCHGVYGP